MGRVPRPIEAWLVLKHDLLMRNWDQTGIGPGMETEDGDWGS